MSCTCGSTEVVKLSSYWEGLPPGTPAHGKLAPPAGPESHYLYAAGLLALGVVATMTGALFGLLAIAGGVGWAAVMRRQGITAETARAVWERMLYCRGCDGKFEAGKA